MEVFAAYINSLAPDRQIAVTKITQLFQENIPQGFEGGMQYKMPSFFVPHALYPNGYHCDKKQPLPFISIASQKNYIAVHHLGIYADPSLLEWFVAEYPKHCSSKLDMGKGCIRFKKVDDIPYDLLKELVTKTSMQEWISLYESKFKK
jgi:hypothetical protein